MGFLDPLSGEMQIGRLHSEGYGKVFKDRRPQPEPKPKPFRHTHIFNPVGLDAWDPRPHPGSKPIAPGTPVRRVQQIGKGKLAFHWVEDEAGNRQSVWKSSLTPKAPRKKKPPA